MERYPDLKLQVVLSDDLVDPVQDGFDVTLCARSSGASEMVA
jgi:DNA-binding transcriptional LysR family regulator